MLGFIKSTLTSILFSTACLVSYQQAVAQQHHPYQEPQQHLFRAAETYQQRLYAIGEWSSERYLREQVPYAPSYLLDKLQAAYISSSSNLLLQREGAVAEAEQLYRSTFEAAKKQRIAYQLAQHFFYAEQMQTAITWYERAGIDNLTNSEIAVAKFQLAYAYLLNKDFPKAEALFGTMRNVPGAFQQEANYYYGLLSYNNGNFSQALQSFLVVKDHPQYRLLVPYYIAEIHYFQGEKETALQEAKSLITASTKSYYHKELNFLAAQILYERKDYAAALPYFNYFYDHSDKIRKDQLFEIGYSAYKAQQLTEAIDKLKPLSTSNDSLGQAAMYVLGDAYLQSNKKAEAKNAFQAASEMDFHKSQQEAAQFLTGKIAYELGRFDEASNTFQRFLSSYPQSYFKTEVVSLQSDLLSRTNNYAEAYQLLSSINASGDLYDKTKQQVSYGYGIQQLQNQNLTEAKALLKESISLPVRNDYTAAAAFWLGEIAYREKEYASAVAYHNQYLSHSSNNLSSISPNATKGNAYNTLGHAAMQLQQYDEAQKYFSDAATYASTITSSTDATLRQADAAFMKKDFTLAANLYDSVIKKQGADQDYALYQKAILLGLRGDTKGQVNALTTIINKKTDSKIGADARLELAGVHLVNSQYAAAILVLKPLVDNNQVYGSRALIKTAYALQELNKEKDAIATYNRVLAEYPDSEEKQLAFDALKSIYIENNQPEEINKLLAQHQGLSGNAVADSSYYQAAINQFAHRNYATAKEGFSNYLIKFPEGNFKLKANYYAAESAMQLKESKQALTYYQAIIDMGTNEYTDIALKNALSLSLKNKEDANAMSYASQLYNTTTTADNKLFALTQLMLLSHQKNDSVAALRYAAELSSYQNLPENTLSTIQFLQAKNAQSTGKLQEALSGYAKTATASNAAIAAESKYRISEIQFLQQQYELAEKTAGSNLASLNGQEKWLVKSYLLLADILLIQKDFFNAKATLKSISKNAKDPALKKEATDKLLQVEAAEKAQSKLAD